MTAERKRADRGASARRVNLIGEVNVATILAADVVGYSRPS